MSGGQNLGSRILGWGSGANTCRSDISLPRISPFCSAAQCPKHSRYQLCLDPSQARLCVPAQLQGLGGRPGCVEGCACDNTHLWARAECVAPEQCGCVHGGRSYQVSWDQADSRAQELPNLSCLDSATGLPRC